MWRIGETHVTLQGQGFQTMKVDNKISPAIYVHVYTQLGEKGINPMPTTDSSTANLQHTYNDRLDNPGQGEGGRGSGGGLGVADDGADAAVSTGAPECSLHVTAAVQSVNELSEETQLCLPIVNGEPIYNIIRSIAQLSTLPPSLHRSTICIGTNFIYLF